MPTGNFAISGLRVFGKGAGEKPTQPKTFMVLRTPKDKRSAWIKWNPVNNAFAYNVYYGTHPEKLYNCVMVLSKNELWLKTLDKEKAYYFTIESINENGVSQKFQTIKVN